jgi:cobaltochelatase CobT
MRGQKIGEVAAWLAIFSEIFEHVSISFEVLGFTSRAWKGGQSRELWLKDGKPSLPGRLNDLRHIVYKDFSSSLEQRKFNFGLMTRDGLLKENLDGEALLWSYKRMMGLKDRQKLLIVISDGAPVDDSTLSVNSGKYLDLHLRSTVKYLSDVSDVKIFAVGIEHDIKRYYPDSETASTSEFVGEVLFRSIPKLIA